MKLRNEMHQDDRLTSRLMTQLLDNPHLICACARRSLSP